MFVVAECVAQYESECVFVFFATPHLAPPFPPLGIFALLFVILIELVLQTEHRDISAVLGEELWNSRGEAFRIENTIQKTAHSKPKPKGDPLLSKTLQKSTDVCPQNKNMQRASKGATQE